MGGDQQESATWRLELRLLEHNAAKSTNIQAAS